MSNEKKNVPKANAENQPATQQVAKKASAKRSTKKATRKVAAKTARQAAKKSASAAKEGVQTAQTTTTQSSKVMEEMMTQGKTQFDQLSQEAAAANQEQANAFMQSGNVFMKGLEDIAKTYMGLAQKAVEKNSEAAKDFLGCRTFNEFAETQNKWARQNFDDFMAGTTKLTELSVKVTTESLEPINDQISKNIKKATDSLAA